MRGLAAIASMPVRTTNMKTINVSVERNPFQVSSKPGSFTNFIVNEPDYDFKGVTGNGPTLELALQDFEAWYEARHNEEVKCIIVQKVNY